MWLMGWKWEQVVKRGIWLLMWHPPTRHYVASYNSRQGSDCYNIRSPSKQEKFPLWKGVDLRNFVLDGCARRQKPVQPLPEQLIKSIALWWIFSPPCGIELIRLHCDLWDWGWKNTKYKLYFLCIKNFCVLFFQSLEAAKSCSGHFFFDLLKIKCTLLTF